MAGLIYGLCALTAAVCTYLLLAAWHRGRYRLLFWAGLCFAGLTLNNLFVVADKIIFPSVDFTLWRTGMALVAMAVLLYGLIWDAE